MAKVTKRERLAEIYTVLADAGRTELAEFVSKEIALVDKRAAAPRKLTTAQRENVTVKQDICFYLNSVTSARASDIARELDWSVQKITALLRQLVSDGYVIRETEGKVVTFRTRD